MKIKEKKLLLWLPESFHIEIQKYSKDKGISVSEAIRQAIKWFLLSNYK